MALLVAVLAYVTVFALLSIRRFESFVFLSRDLAMYQQMFWNAINGRWFRGTMFYAGEVSLADHFSPGLFLLTPLYALWPDPRLLLVAQSLAYGVAAIPIYLFGRRRLPSNWKAGLVALAYLVQPGLHRANLFEFHEISLAVPLIATALWLADGSPLRRRWLLAVLLLALTVKEDVSLVVAAFGVYLALIRRERALGAVVVVAGLVWAAVVIGYVMPALNTDRSGFVYVRQYEGLGDTPGAILLTAATRPLVVIARVSAEPKLLFLRDLLLPLGFLPVLAPEVLLLGLPTLGYLLLSNDPTFATIAFHHQALLMPILGIAASVGLARAARLASMVIGLRRGSVPAWRRAVAPGWLAASALVGVYLFGWGPLPGNLSLQRFAVDDSARLTARFLRDVPPGLAVAASGNLVAGLANRRSIKEFPDLNGAKVVALDLRGVDPSDAGQMGHAQWLAMRKIWRDERWDLREARGKLLLLEHRPVGLPREWRPLSTTFGGELRLVGYRLELGRAARPGDELRLVTWWRALAPIAQDYVVTLQLFDEAGQRVWIEDAQPWNGAFPTSQWPLDRPVRDVRYVPIPPSARPGQYWLRLGVHPRESERALPVLAAGPIPDPGRVWLGPIEVRRAGEPREWDGVWRPLELIFGHDSIALRRGWVNRLRVRRGDLLHTALEWEALAPTRENYTVFLHLRDAGFRIWAQRDEQPGQGYQATHGWRLGRRVQTTMALKIGPEVPVGRYSLDVGLYDPVTLARLPIDGGDSRAQATIAEVDVEN